MINKFNFFISLYSYKYLRSLLYLLQKTEYTIAEFCKLFFNVADFRKVEIRSRLVFTAKIRIIYSVLELTRILLFLLCFIEIFFLRNPLFLIVFFASPFIFLLETIVITYLLKLIQKPIELYLIYKAKNKLQRMTATKIAIAGSYGKTSMREILYTVLREGMKVATVKENYNTPLGIASFIMKLKGDEEILIFEFGEYYKGDIKYLCEFVNPDIGIITGINEAHLDKFKSIKNTISTIFELSDYLDNKNVYVNVDNNYSAKSIRKDNISFGLAGIDDIVPKNVVADLSGTQFIVGNTKYKTKLIGVHNVGAILLSMYLARKFFINQRIIQKGIANITPFKNRLELKNLPNNILLLDDTYNGNIDGFLVTFKFLRTIKNRRIVYITPGLVEAGTEKERLHRQIGEEISKSNIKNVILIKNTATPFIEVGLNNANFSGNLTYFNSMLDVLSKLHTITLENDLVVIQNDWGDQYY